MGTSSLKCQNCGAELKWSPKTGNWACEFCDTQYENINEAAYIENSQPQYENILKCSYCGAEVTTNETDITTFCIYCKRPVTVQSAIEGQFKPNFIIPFAVDESEIETELNNYFKNKKYLPDDFKNNIKDVRGIYVPFWLYNVNTDFDFKGIAKEIKRWTNGNRNYTKTDTYNVERRGSMFFENISVDASKSIDNDLMDSIEPFSFNDIKPFSKAYLSGFLTQKYDVDKELSFERAKERLVTSQEEKIAESLARFQEISFLDKKYQIKDIIPSYALMPVWFLTIMYKDKPYYLAMNGQTRKFVGNLVADKNKVIKHILKLIPLTLIGTLCTGFLWVLFSGYL